MSGEASRWTSGLAFHGCDPQDPRARAPAANPGVETRPPGAVEAGVPCGRK